MIFFFFSLYNTGRFLLAEWFTLKSIYVINILWAFACKTIVYYSQDIGSKLAWWDPGGTMSSIFILYAQHNDSGADKAALSPQSDPAPPVA